MGVKFLRKKRMLFWEKMSKKYVPKTGQAAFTKSGLRTISASVGSVWCGSDFCQKPVFIPFSARKSRTLCPVSTDRRRDPSNRPAISPPNLSIASNDGPCFMGRWPFFSPDFFGKNLFTDHEYRQKPARNLRRAR